MTIAHDDLLQRLGSDPILAALTFEPIEVAGLHAVVARLVPPERSVTLWRAARACCMGTYWPILTDDNQVHPDIEEIRLDAPMPLSDMRSAREQVMRPSKEACAALLAIPRATPQPELYEERDIFLEDPENAAISLVLVHAPMVEAVCPFTSNGEGIAPRHVELITMLRHWNEQHGAEPLYADGDLLELEVRRPPRDLDALRALARDFFLLSQGTREGYGIEDPARLLRRLMSDRWVVWWYGTT